MLTAKRTRGSKLPAMIKTEDNMKTLHNAMPSDLEGKRFANSDVLTKLVETVLSQKKAVFQRSRAQPFAIKRNKNIWKVM